LEKRNKFILKLLRIAEEDLNDIIGYVFENNRGAAVKLLESFEKVFTRLVSYLYLGKFPDELDLMQKGYRYFIHKDYVIFYKIENENILVYRILHSAREIKNLL